MRRAAAEPAFETSPASFANASPAFFRDSFSAAARSARSPATASRAADLADEPPPPAPAPPPPIEGSLIADGILGADDLPCTALMSAADADRPSRALADPASRCSLATLPLAMPCTSMYCVTTAIETTLLRIAWIEASMLWAVPATDAAALRRGVGDARPIPGMCEAALAPTCSRVTMAILATLTANRACSASTTNMPATTLRNVSECFQARTNAPARAARPTTMRPTGSRSWRR